MVKMEETGSWSQIFLFQPLLPTWTLGINTGANRQCSATAADKGLAEDATLLISTRLHRAPSCPNQVPVRFHKAV